MPSWATEQLDILVDENGDPLTEGPEERDYLVMTNTYGWVLIVDVTLREDPRVVSMIRLPEEEDEITAAANVWLIARIVGCWYRPLPPSRRPSAPRWQTKKMAPAYNGLPRTPDLFGDFAVGDRPEQSILLRGPIAHGRWRYSALPAHSGDRLRLDADLGCDLGIRDLPQAGEDLLYPPRRRLGRRWLGRLQAQMLAPGRDGTPRTPDLLGDFDVGERAARDC